jgi:hypothetical protein
MNFDDLLNMGSKGFVVINIFEKCWGTVVDAALRPL